MTRPKAMRLVRYCEGRTRSGGLCKLPAGHGTAHVGRGRCARHGGATPNHERKAAREIAHEFVVGQLGHEVEIDPLEGAVLAVRMAAGARAYWLAKLGDAYEAGEEPSQLVVEGYRIAMQDLGRMSDVASKAGVAERLITITEGMAERISLAFEQAAMAANVSAKARVVMVKVFAEALGQIEQDDEPLALPSGGD